MSDESSIPADLLALLRPGNSLRLDYGPGNINNKTIHIRAIVDGWQIVYCWWVPRRRRWKYEIESVYWFADIPWRAGALRRARRRFDPSPSG